VIEIANLAYNPKAHHHCHCTWTSTSSFHFLKIQLIIYGLFNDDVSSPDYAASNGKMSEWIGKDVEGSSHGQIKAPYPYLE
jgi:hypothetical protein